MVGNIPQLKPRELIRALERNGFIIRRTTGSHVILHHPETGHITSVPYHSGDVKRGLLFAIVRQAGLKIEDLL
jgi:predicted RNA binding protein YcfA (HicA-like mRNA interferase family)